PQRLGDVGETGGAVGHCRGVDEERQEDFGKGEGGEGEILAPQTQGGPARNGGEDHSYETGDQRRQQRMEIESPSILIEGRLAGWSRREDGERVGADGEVGDDTEVDQTRFPVLEVERAGHHTVDPEQDADADDSREQRAHSVLPEIPLGMKIRTRITIPKAMMSLKPAPIHSRETSRATPMARADTTSDQIDPTPARSATAKMMRICSKPLVVVRAPRTASATPPTPARAEESTQEALAAWRTSTPRDAPRFRSRDVIRMAVPIRVRCRNQAVPAVTSMATATTIT